MSGELISCELQKFEKLYQLAESYIKGRGTKHFGLATIGELIALLSANLSQFRDEQKTEAIVSVLRRLYKGSLVQEKIANLSVGRQEKLANFINNALPYYVDMTDEFVVPFNLLQSVRGWWNYLVKQIRFPFGPKNPEIIVPETDAPVSVASVSGVKLNINTVVNGNEVKTNTFRDTVRETQAAAN